MVAATPGSRDGSKHIVSGEPVLLSPCLQAALTPGSCVPRKRQRPSGRGRLLFPLPRFLNHSLLLDFALWNKTTVTTLVARPFIMAFPGDYAPNDPDAKPRACRFMRDFSSTAPVDPLAHSTLDVLHETRPNPCCTV